MSEGSEWKEYEDKHQRNLAAGNGLTPGEMFFFTYASFHWNCAVEKRKEARIRNAVELNRAYEWAQKTGLVYTFSQKKDCNDMYDIYCSLPHGEYVTHRYNVFFGKGMDAVSTYLTAAYARVLMAEMARDIVDFSSGIEIIRESSSPTL